MSDEKTITLTKEEIEEIRKQSEEEAEKKESNAGDKDGSSEE